ncbi:unnamed protein product [Urochloa decumbens]|uniref:Uncharacterized protein n=1 Tax=Urochloa decumbens TaxID=240449 RepID=A0ABC9B2X0_9POAL
MEAVLISRAVGILLTKLTETIEKNMKLRKELKTNLHDIKCEMVMINQAVQKYAESKELRWWILEVQELAYDIEDKIDEFTERLACSAKAGWVGRKIHQQKTKGTRVEFAEEIQVLKERARRAYERRNTFMGGAAPSAPEQDPGPSSTKPYIPEDELVGIAESKKEVLKLLEPAAEGEQERLRVISIVGCRGIGKTTLAKVVFQSLDGKCSASAVASECKDGRGLLADILFKMLGGEKDTTSSLEQLGENLSRHLQAQERYLIFVDDIQTDVWETIKFSFPINIGGRIIVTTSIQSIAEEWISNGGFVYKMETLSDVDSKALLMKEIFGHRTESSPDFDGLQTILKKCDGLPLALINIAQLLKKPHQRTSIYCSKLCRDLGSHLHNEKVLSRMKRVLIHSYNDLPSHDLKTCLLSVSIFPEDHHIKRKRLIRRWLAEGLVVKDVGRNLEDVASDRFEELIDRSMIQTVCTSNSAAVKTCQVRGVLLDFIAHKSASENFITFINSNEPISKTESEATCAVRRLSLHNTTETGAIVNNDFSRIRSLTIFGHVGGYIEFQKCKFLRVLDLEKCTELKETDIHDICKLMQLKYLSLRGTNVSEIPKEISNLQHLETLDIRETNVTVLPIEVFNLPQLAHLFGQFKLPCQLNKVREGHKLQKFFSQSSRLQTLAGFFIDANHAFPQILLHISKLRKVKVLSDGIQSEDSVNLLISSLQGRFLGDNALQSLSIDFGDHSIDFLDYLKPPCLLTSVKLHGKLTKLPDFIKSLQDLELHLSSTSLCSACLLSALESLDRLLYLKLVEDCSEFVNSSFDFRSDGFPRLQRLCIQAPKLPNLNIQDGAMRCLISLRLLCVDISGFPVDCIGNLNDLKEISLATSVSADTRKAWETAAKQHKNRPELM